MQTRISILQSQYLFYNGKQSAGASLMIWKAHRQQEQELSPFMGSELAVLPKC